MCETEFQSLMQEARAHGQLDVCKEVLEWEPETLEKSRNG